MTNKEQVHVTIDSNEESQNLESVEIFVMHEDVEGFDIEPLETGDFIIGECMFERKTPTDFAGSVKKGRLREQVERMAGSGYSPYVLVEGDMSDFSNLEHSRMPAKSLRGMAASIMARHNIPVVFCSNPENLADIAVRIARKTSEDVSTAHVKKANTVKDVPFIVKFFMNFDGVGLETAEELAREFDTIQAVLDAEETDFQKIDGIGPKTTEKLMSTLHDEFKDVSEQDDGVTHVRI